ATDKQVQTLATLPAAQQQAIHQTLAGPAAAVQVTNGYLLFYQPVGRAPWRMVFQARQSDVLLSLAGRVGLQVLVVMLGLAIMLMTATRATPGELIGPAIRLVRHIAAESRGAGAAPPPVPAPWQPWFAAVSRTFAQNRELLAELRQREQRLTAEVQELR